MFGQGTGRQVHIGSPVVTHFKAPGKPIHTADARVSPRHRPLLDTPAQGMTTVTRRVIVYPNGKSRQDKLKSVYRAWGVVYGVHPRDRRLKEA